MSSDIKLLIASLIPVAATILFYLLDEHTSFGEMNSRLRQTIIGIVFGGIAILGTEWGIPVEGAVVNCRDAAPLCAGLFFGGPAGIIAGLIGGIERWIAVAWGVGSFTRVACSVSTAIAGIYAALLRKYMFKGRRPGWGIAFACGIVMESFHLTMVFVTNLNSAETAARVVMACAKHMLAANGLAVLLAAIALTLLNHESLRFDRENTGIELFFQRGLFACFFAAFVITSVFVFFLQNGLAEQSIKKNLLYSVEDVVVDITQTIDDDLLSRARRTAEKATVTSLDDLLGIDSIDEINMVGKNGIIFASTEPQYVGFDMRSSVETSEFMCLLNGTKAYVQPMIRHSFDSDVLRNYAGIATDYGFVQVGFTEEHYNEIIDHELSGTPNYRHIGETGAVFIIDENDKISSGPAEYINYSLKFTSLLDDIEANSEDSVFSSFVFGTECLVNYRTLGKYRIVAFFDREEAYSERNTSIYVNTFLEIMVFAVLFAFVNTLVRKVVLNRIERINTSLSKITAGDLDEVVNVRENAEFAQLSDDINATVTSLKGYIADAEKRIEDELVFAKNIQASTLPNVFPAFPKRKDFDIFSSMDPAKEVGGDFYDFYITNFDGVEALNFLVADVSGKGIPAAMFMMKAKTLLKNLTENDLPMEEVFFRANNGLCEGNDEVGMFVTALQGRMDLKTGELTMINAGHNPPLVKHRNGMFEFVKLKPGLVLAGMDGVPYRSATVNFAKGDTIFLYTDGVSEATNEDNELYGEERLLNALNTVPYTDMEQLCVMVRKDIDDFVGNAPQFDDITMTAIHYFGTMERRETSYDSATLEDIPDVTEFVENALGDMGCPEQMMFKIDVVVDEIFSNICNYAYGGEPGIADVVVEETQDPHGARIIFADKGVQYDPLKKTDPDITLALEDRAIGGLGIFMVKKSVDEISYEYENGRNILTVGIYF